MKSKFKEAEFIKLICCIILLAILCFGNMDVFRMNVEAKTVKAKNYVGVYYMKGGQKNPTERYGAYNIIIKKIKNGYVTFYVSEIGSNYSPIYETDMLKAKIKNGKASFKWNDSWGNSGKGTILFVKRHRLKLNMKQTQSSDFNRSTLDTNGKKVFLFSRKLEKE